MKGHGLRLHGTLAEETCLSSTAAAHCRVRRISLRRKLACRARHSRCKSNNNPCLQMPSLPVAKQVTPCSQPRTASKTARLQGTLQTDPNHPSRGCCVIAYASQSTSTMAEDEQTPMGSVRLLKRKARKPDTSSGGLSGQASVDVIEDIGTSEIAGDQLAAHPVVELMLSRWEQGTTPGRRAAGDNFKLGLVVEGGGMRGIISGAMLMALEAAGLRGAFDAVYGASAGAINATYYLSGQQEGLRIYEHLAQSSFIDLSALLSGGRPVMDLSYLIDNVMNDICPLDWQKVLSSSCPLKVVASSLNSLSPVLLTDFTSPAELAECLKASAAVPHLAGEPRQVRGDCLVDAAVFEPVPVRTALADGCTHVLALCTRPATLTTTWHRRLVRGTVARVVKRTVLNAPYMTAAWAAEGNSMTAAKDEELVRTLKVPPQEAAAAMGAYVLPMYPPHTASCHPLTTSPKVLRDAEEVGWGAVSALLGVDPVLLRMGLQGGHQSGVPGGGAASMQGSSAPLSKDSSRGGSKGSGRLSHVAAEGSTVASGSAASSTLWQRTTHLQLPQLLLPLFSRGSSQQRQS